MSEIFAYRADNELSAAWRAAMAERDRHIETVVEPFQQQHPDHRPLIDQWERMLGFTDGVPHEPPPSGLSRSQKRDHLIPVRGKAGDVWREHMRRLELPRTKASLFEHFGLREQLYVGSDGRHYLGRPNIADFGEDGVFVYTGYEIETVPDCLTAVKLSEFYAARERAQERAGAAS